MGKATLRTSCVWLLCLGASAAMMQSAMANGGPTPSSQNAVVNRYCIRCHNDSLRRGELTLEGFDVAHANQSVEVAEKMIRKLRAGMMPPPPSRRPDAATYAELIGTLETTIDDAAGLDPNPGERTFQRLNRAEYSRSIRDLLGLEIDAGDYLPLDTVSANFDNIADVQLLSPTLMDAYLRAAGEISRLAAGDRDATPSEVAYKVSRWISQREQVDGAPYGTRGGTSVVHVFPADGDYVFRVSFHHETTGALFGNGRGALHTADGAEKLEVSINGEPVALLELDRWMHASDPDGVTMQTDPIAVRAGPQRVSAAFVRRFEGPLQDLISPHEWSLASTSVAGAYGITSLPHLRDLVIRGPYAVTGVSDTPSRRKIFTCLPASPEAEICAEKIIRKLGSGAYRRPLSFYEVANLMSFYRAGVAEFGFEDGIRGALEAILASPHFVFRFERPPADARSGHNYRINDFELASRLSFFLWASVPDEELIELARHGELAEPVVLEEQVRRMLANPRSEALSTRFAAQWLRLQDLDEMHPDVRLYPDFDQQLKDAMRHETELFFEALVRDDGGLLELLTADYTFVNERLARHYGITGVVGTRFQRVRIPDENRRGLLGHGSILTLTSHAGRTSPVMRGKWVMEVFLGISPPPPPPDVPDLDETQSVEEGRGLSVRERLEHHRSDPACRSCHRVIDPIGLALENFDSTGAWRLRDNGGLIDAVGELYDGSPLSGPAELRDALLRRRESFVRTFTENLMAYALGRRLEYTDMPAVRVITREAAAEDYRLTALILGVVNSAAFQMSRIENIGNVGGEEG